MSTGYQIIEQDKLHFVTFLVVRWIDNHYDVIDEDTWLYDDNYDYSIWRNTDMDAASLARLKTPEGYIAGSVRLSGRWVANHFYYRKDHLGNNREVWRASNNSVIQRTQYNASGLPWYESEGQHMQPYKYGGKEFDRMHGLDWYDFHARMQDPVLQRFHTMDPMVEEYYSVSPYAYCGNNPVNRIDPDGKDWYEDENGNAFWQEGDDETVTRTHTGENGESITIEYKNVGQYYTIPTFDNSTLLHFDQSNIIGVTELDSDIGKKYSMLAAEGGWIKDNNGTVQRETLYGLYIIGASMENRLNNPKFFPNSGTFESLFSPEQYNAANHSTYKNLPSKFSQWKNWYGTKDVMGYLNAVYSASVNNCVNILQSKYGFVDANKILGYSHNGYIVFQRLSLPLQYDKSKTLLKSVETSRNVFP